MPALGLINSCRNTTITQNTIFLKAFTKPSVGITLLNMTCNNTQLFLHITAHVHGIYIVHVITFVWHELPPECVVITTERAVAVLYLFLGVKIVAHEL